MSAKVSYPTRKERAFPNADADLSFALPPYKTDVELCQNNQIIVLSTYVVETISINVVGDTYVDIRTSFIAP